MQSVFGMKSSEDQRAGLFADMFIRAYICDYAKGPEKRFATSGYSIGRSRPTGSHVHINHIPILRLPDFLAGFLQAKVLDLVQKSKRRSNLYNSKNCVILRSGQGVKAGSG